MASQVSPTRSRERIFQYQKLPMTILKSSLIDLKAKRASEMKERVLSDSEDLRQFANKYGPPAELMEETNPFSLLSEAELNHRGVGERQPPQFQAHPEPQTGVGAAPRAQRPQQGELYLQAGVGIIVILVALIVILKLLGY